MKLKNYNNKFYDPGRNFFTRSVWLLLNSILLSSWIPGSWWRCSLLKIFGAEIGKNVIIRPRVSVKYPWYISISDDCWIGEKVWIDNIYFVSIGHDVCLSQGVYLCTGSHDWSSPNFDLVGGPIEISPHAWICAKAVVGPSTKICEGGVVSLGCAFTGHLDNWSIATIDNIRIRERRRHNDQ